MLATSWTLPVILACFATQSPNDNAPQTSKISIDGIAWLAGHWASTNGRQTGEEHWTPPAGGTMFGISRTIVGDRTVFFEFLRIELTDDGIIYYASPKGRCPPTPFKLRNLENHRVVFANPEHDFPQSITYWLDKDDVLHARIEGKQNGRSASSEWQWTRAD